LTQTVRLLEERARSSPGNAELYRERIENARAYLRRANEARLARMVAASPSPKARSPSPKVRSPSPKSMTADQLELFKLIKQFEKDPDGDMFGDLTDEEIGVVEGCSSFGETSQKVLLHRLSKFEESPWKTAMSKLIMSIQYDPEAQ
jgi:hypothetical protein